MLLWLKEITVDVSETFLLANSESVRYNGHLRRS